MGQHGEEKKTTTRAEHHQLLLMYRPTFQLLRRTWKAAKKPPSSNDDDVPVTLYGSPLCDSSSVSSREMTPRRFLLGTTPKEQPIIRQHRAVSNRILTTGGELGVGEPLFKFISLSSFSSSFFLLSSLSFSLHFCFLILLILFLLQLLSSACFSLSSFLPYV